MSILNDSDLLKRFIYI